MKILSEKNVKILEIEYEPNIKNRKNIEKYLDDTYGKMYWSIRHIDPNIFGDTTKYIMTVEITLKD